MHAHPTPNAIHVGDAEVAVAQGNHAVSIPSHGQPEPAYSMEVLHLPWRSWSQFEQKVLHAGRAYEASPTQNPSRNHHGMADYRRAKEGWLREVFSARLPSEAEVAASDSFVEDRWLSEYLHALVPRAHNPVALQEALDSSNDEPWPADVHARLAELGDAFLALEQTGLRHREEADELRATVRRLRGRVRRLRRERDEAIAAEAHVVPWIPVRADVARVSRRLALAVRDRLRRTR
jgi:hypothetical protein